MNTTEDLLRPLNIMRTILSILYILERDIFLRNLHDWEEDSLKPNVQEITSIMAIDIVEMMKKVAGIHIFNTKIKQKGKM